MAMNVSHEVAALQQMTVKDLRARFADFCRDETRSGNKAWLIKRIAWQLQANRESGLTERARQRNGDLACDADLRLFDSVTSVSQSGLTDSEDGTRSRLPGGSG